MYIIHFTLNFIQRNGGILSVPPPSQVFVLPSKINVNPVYIFKGAEKILNQILYPFSLKTQINFTEMDVCSIANIILSYRQEYKL